MARIADIFPHRSKEIFSFSPNQKYAAEDNSSSQLPCPSSEALKRKDALSEDRAPCYFILKND